MARRLLPTDQQLSGADGDSLKVRLRRFYRTLPFLQVFFRMEEYATHSKMGGLPEGVAGSIPHSTVGIAQLNEFFPY
jgi:hypothetical protein